MISDFQNPLPTLWQLDKTKTQCLISVHVTFKTALLNFSVRIVLLVHAKKLPLQVNYIVLHTSNERGFLLL